MILVLKLTIRIQLKSVNHFCFIRMISYNLPSFLFNQQFENKLFPLKYFFIRTFKPFIII